jgi:hypothetical protein
VSASTLFKAQHLLHIRSAEDATILPLADRRVDPTVRRVLSSTSAQEYPSSHDSPISQVGSFLAIPPPRYFRLVVRCHKGTPFISQLTCHFVGLLILPITGLSPPFSFTTGPSLTSFTESFIHLFLPYRCDASLDHLSG